MLAVRLAKPMKIGEALLVTLAPRRDAVAEPILFRRDLARQFVMFQLFLFEHLVAPGLEFGEAAGEMKGDAAIEPEGFTRQILQEAAIVADQDERRAQASEFRFQPFDR